MDVRTLEDFRTILKAAKHFNKDKIEIETFEALLNKSEEMQRENESLYEKLNDIRSIVNQDV